MENLTKENFWNDLMVKYPTAMKIFCAWIDQYKKQVGWAELFDPTGSKKDKDLPKYHDLPLAMQIGIFLQFAFQNGKFYSDIELTSYSGDGPEEWKRIIREYFRTANVDDGAVSLVNAPLE